MSGASLLYQRWYKFVTCLTLVDMALVRHRLVLLDIEAGLELRPLLNDFVEARPEQLSVQGGQARPPRAGVDAQHGDGLLGVHVIERSIIGEFVALLTLSKALNVSRLCYKLDGLTFFSSSASTIRSMIVLFGSRWTKPNCRPQKGFPAVCCPVDGLSL